MNDPYGGRKPGCFDIFLAFEATLAILVFIFSVLG